MDEVAMITELNRLAREMTTIRQLVSDVVNYMRDAESEIPEKMRRFMNYFHDVHDVKYIYEESGHDAPDYILREIERLHDRYRQLLHEQHTDTGAFEKVRAKMAADPLNRYDHTRLLPGQEKTHATRESK